MALTLTLTLVLTLTGDPHGAVAKPASKGVGGGSNLGATVKELFDVLDLMQVKRNKPFEGPQAWQEDKGLYPSYVRLNFVGAPEVAMLRELIAVFDNNMFATAWITSALLEAHRYAAAPRPSDTQMGLALDAIALHYDRNQGGNTSVMTFWPQAWDKNTSLWVSTPANLLNAFNVFDQLPWDKIDKFFDELGWQNVDKFLHHIRDSKSGYLRAFHIPPDFDDTFVNLGLGSLLADMATDMPKSFATWKGHNSNLTSVLAALRKYAYRPFSNNEAINSIDPRTYYYLRHFLDYANAKNLSVAIVPTWVQDIEGARKLYSRGVVMPFQINNVDVTVAANAVYGLTGAVLSGLLPQDCIDPKKDPEIAQVYHNTTMMIAFMTENKLFGRPDLALTYYPSVFEFYWFVARTFHRMELALQERPLPKVMQELFPVLKSALEGAMTRDVLSRGNDEGDVKYYDDFLGDGDVDKNNQTKVRGEDRLYTTTMAVNALLTTWTLANATTGHVTWRTGTPDAVKVTAEKCTRWLSKNILGVDYKPWNAFFSGSAKGHTTYPFEYPGNRLETLNGTRVKNHSHWPHNWFTWAVEGYMPEDEYESQIKNKTAHFNEDTPTEFITYNSPSGFFPFWSSPAYTYATTMLALGRYDSIQ